MMMLKELIGFLKNAYVAQAKKALPQNDDAPTFEHRACLQELQDCKLQIHHLEKQLAEAVAKGDLSSQYAAAMHQECMATAATLHNTKLDNTRLELELSRTKKTQRASRAVCWSMIGFLMVLIVAAAMALQFGIVSTELDGVNSFATWEVPQLEAEDLVVANEVDVTIQAPPMLAKDTVYTADIYVLAPTEASEHPQLTISLPSAVGKSEPRAVKAKVGTEADNPQNTVEHPMMTEKELCLAAGDRRIVATLMGETAVRKYLADRDLVTESTPEYAALWHYQLDFTTQTARYRTVVLLDWVSLEGCCAILLTGMMCLMAIIAMAKWRALSATLRKLRTKKEDVNNVTTTSMILIP